MELERDLYPVQVSFVRGLQDKIKNVKKTAFLKIFEKKPIRNVRRILNLKVDYVSLRFGGADADVKGVHNGLPDHNR